MFERKSMEQLVESMIKWTRGASTRITDFRVGSKIRTIYEAVGLVIEELYDKVFRSMRKTVEENIYSIIGFDKLPATYAHGTVRLSRSTPAEENYYIPSGTVIKSRATEHKAPLTYRTTKDALLSVGHTSVDVSIVANTPGELGNAGVGMITEFVQKPVGVDFVSNLSIITGGKEEETKEEQKARFQTYIEANARGIIQSIEYGASLATITSEEQVVLESVHQAVAIEYIPERKGEVDVYIWNGVGEASEELKSAVLRILAGYYREDGSPVYGYKPAGIITNVYTAPIKYATIKLEIIPESWASIDDVQREVETAIDIFFGSVKLGNSLIQTALEAEIKFVDGVHDVKLYLSLDDGETFTMDNIHVAKSEIIIPKKPLLFEINNGG